MNWVVILVVGFTVFKVQVYLAQAMYHDMDALANESMMTTAKSYVASVGAQAVLPVAQQAFMLGPAAAISMFTANRMALMH